MLDKLNPYMALIKIAAVILLLVGVFWRGHSAGEKSVQDKWDLAKAAQLADDNRALIKRNADNAALQAKHDREVIELKKGHRDEIAQITAVHDSAMSQRLRIPAAACKAYGTTGSAKTKGAGGSDAATSGAGLFPEAAPGNLPGPVSTQAGDTIELPEAIDRGLKDLMLKADQITASCRVAQKFVTDNGMAP